MTDERARLNQVTRDDLLKRMLSNNENFDRAILTLTSAALGVSVVFINGHRPVLCHGVLLCTWLFLVLAIISTVVSYLVSQCAIRRQLELAEEYYIKENSKVSDAPNRASTWHERLTYVSAITFIVGIVSLLVFFWLNT